MKKNNYTMQESEIDILNSPFSKNLGWVTKKGNLTKAGKEIANMYKNENIIKTPFGLFKKGEKVWYWVYDIGKKPGIITKKGVQAVGAYRQYCKKNRIALIAKWNEIDNITRRKTATK